MGKDSLLESTSKKKPKAKKAKGKAAKKAVAPKGKARKAPAKAKAKPKGAPAKKIAAKAAKAPAKVKKGAARKKAPAKPKPAKKPTRKELLFKKFATPPAKPLYAPPTEAGDTDDTSPSYFAGMSDATVATEMKRFSSPTASGSVMSISANDASNACSASGSSAITAANRRDTRTNTCSRGRSHAWADTTSAFGSNPREASIQHDNRVA